MIRCFGIALFLACVCVPMSLAQSGAREVYVVFDASGSMWGQLPDRSYKIQVARDVLTDFLERDFGNAVLSFRAYGHRRKGDCRDSELIADAADPAVAAARIRTFMADVNPLGMTPIAYSLTEALADFGENEGDIILITDGVETCDADPCALVRDWKSRGIDVQVHVVGFGVEDHESAALQCIADAAGTPYHEAASGMDLTLGLESIRESLEAQPGPGEQPRDAAFWLKGVTPNGEPIAIEGELQGVDGTVPVSSNRRNQAPAGTYVLVAGVKTQNGTLYKPVTVQATLAGQADEELIVQVAQPPSVRARFSSEGETVAGSTITALQNNREVFRFRWMDEVFVDEGSYTFRAQPNQDNVIEREASFVAGDKKELLFDLVPTVRAVIRMVASGSDERLRGNYTLWQGGEQKYQVHMNNGADVVPGVYDVHLENELIPVLSPAVRIDRGGDVLIEVPVGRVTFLYQQADGSREEDKRVFLGRGATERGRAIQSGLSIPLIPGQYNAVGWPAGIYESIVFEVVAGEEKTMVLRAR